MIKIYIADSACLKNTEIYNNKYHSLPKFRKEKVDHVRFDNDKRLELAAGLILSHSLSELGIDINEAGFAKNDYGKPYLENCPDIHFNLSHSHEMVMCAVSDSDIGCDIQYCDSLNTDLLNIAKRFFTPAEYTLLSDTKSHDPDGSLMRSIFYEIWVMKESCIKLNGKGLSLALNSFESLPCCKQVSFEADNEGFDYYIRSYELSLPYKCAAASVKNDFPEDLINVDLSL